MKKFPVFCVAYVQVKGTTLPVYQMYHCKGFTILWKEHSTKNEKIYFRVLNLQCSHLCYPACLLLLKVKVSRVQLFGTPWTIRSVEFSRPKYCTGQPFPSPGDLPVPGVEPRSPALQAESLPVESQRKPFLCCCLVVNSCLILCDPIDCNPQGSSVHGVFQARMLDLGCPSLLQGIFLTQGLNPYLLHCRHILSLLSHHQSLKKIRDNSYCSVYLINQLGRITEPKLLLPYAVGPLCSWIPHLWIQPTLD